MSITLEPLINSLIWISVAVAVSELIIYLWKHQS